MSKSTYKAVGTMNEGRRILDCLRCLFGGMKSGEKMILSKSLEIASLASISVRTAVKMIEEEAKRDLENLERELNEIISMEKKGDEITLGIVSDITRGEIAAGLREGLLEFTQKLDDILDMSHVMAREIMRVSRFSPLRKSSEVVQILSDIAEVGKDVISAVDKLTELIKGASEGELRPELAVEIERIEEKVDDKKEYVLDKIYSVGRYLHCLEVLHLVDLIRLLDDATDYCEDASQVLVNIIRSLE